MQTLMHGANIPWLIIYRTSYISPVNSIFKWARNCFFSNGRCSKSLCCNKPLTCINLLLSLLHYRNTNESKRFWPQRSLLRITSSRHGNRHITLVIHCQCCLAHPVLPLIHFRVERGAQRYQDLGIPWYVTLSCGNSQATKHRNLEASVFP